MANKVNRARKRREAVSGIKESFDILNTCVDGVYYPKMVSALGSEEKAQDYIKALLENF